MAMSSNRMVGALLFDDGRVLLGHRTKTRAEFPGVWDMVGGHVERHESLAGALRRELKEELGVEVVTTSEWWRQVEDESVPVMLTIWLVTEWEGAIRNRAPEEHSELRWFRRDELGGLVFPHPLYAKLLDAAFDVVGSAPT
jgi:8-oxo-dGTP diphosphatase